MSELCLHKTRQSGKDWWFCSECGRGEREIVSEDIIVTLPLDAPLTPSHPKPSAQGKLEPALPYDERIYRILRGAIERNRLISLKNLRKYAKGLPKVRRALHVLEAEGWVERVEKESAERLYRRTGSFKMGEVQLNKEDKLESIMAILPTNRPMSRTKLMQKLWWSAELFDEVMGYLIEKEVAKEYFGRRLYYKWKGGK